MSDRSLIKTVIDALPSIITSWKEKHVAIWADCIVPSKISDMLIYHEITGVVLYQMEQYDFECCGLDRLLAETLTIEFQILKESQPIWTRDFNNLHQMQGRQKLRKID